MLMAFLQIALFLAAACAVVSGQSTCTELRNSDVVLFRRGGSVENACRQSCVTNTGRVRTGLFSCCPGFAALVTIETDRRVVDARDGAVLCIPTPTAELPTEPTVDGLPDEFQPTTTTSIDPQTPTTPESYPRCPSSGPTSFLEFTITARNGGLVCETRCQFGVAADGVAFDVKTRTLYQCCTGEPIYVRYRQYDCPPEELPTEPIVDGLPDEFQPTEPIVDGLPDEIQPTTTTSIDSQTPTTSESYPRCPSSGPTSFLEFTITARNGGLVCETRCQFGVAADGVAFDVKTRTLYQCCEGEPIYVRYRQYDCPAPGTQNSTG